MVICLRQVANLHMAQLMPLPLTVSWSSKSRLVLHNGSAFLVPAYQVVLEKRSLKECSVIVNSY